MTHQGPAAHAPLEGSPLSGSAAFGGPVVSYSAFQDGSRPRIACGRCAAARVRGPGFMLEGVGLPEDGWPGWVPGLPNKLQHGAVAQLFQVSRQGLSPRLLQLPVASLPACGLIARRSGQCDGSPPLPNAP